MSGMKRYISWCEDNEYTNEVGEVVSMEYADEYMRSDTYDREHREQAFKQALQESDEDSLLGMAHKMNESLKRYDILNGTNFSK